MRCRWISFLRLTVSSAMLLFSTFKLILLSDNTKIKYTFTCADGELSGHRYARSATRCFGKCWLRNACAQHFPKPHTPGRINHSAYVPVALFGRYTRTRKKHAKNHIHKTLRQESCLYELVASTSDLREYAYITLTKNATLDTAVRRHQRLILMLF